MIFCEKCFNDREIIPIIQEYDEIGDSQICHSRDIYVYNTKKHENLPICSKIL